MNNKPKFVNEPPFYYKDGKGWFIKGKFKHDGKWYDVQQQYFPSKRDAMCAYDSAIQRRIEKIELDSLKKAEEAKVRYEDLRESFLELRRGDVRGSSMSSQDFPTLRIFFDPMFKGMAVEDMFRKESAIAFRKSVEAYERRNTKNKNRAITMYVRMLDYAYLSDFLKDEKEYKACKLNMRPFSSANLPESPRKKEKHALTPDEIGKLLKHTDGTKDAFLMRMLWATACRINELLALKPCDFDLETGTVKIQRQWGLSEQRTYFLTNVLKNKKGYRTIPLTNDIILLYKRYVYERALNADDLLFEGDEVRHMDIKALNKRIKKYCREAGITEVTAHEFRHSKSTLFSTVTVTDEDKQAASYIIGHSVTVDQQVYAAHVKMEKAKELIKETHKA